MLNSIKAEVNRRSWNLHRQRGLLAVSGGRDSVALFYAFMELGYEFEVAHINYGLRGSESDGDEDFVKKICNNHHIICHVHRANPETSAPGESTQMWARRVRYDFFGGILSSRNLDYTAVAHHAGDPFRVGGAAPDDAGDLFGQGSDLRALRAAGIGVVDDRLGA